MQGVHGESDVYALLAVLLRHGQILGLLTGVHQVVVPIAIALQLIDSRVLGCKETLVPCGVDDLVASKPLLSQPDAFLQEVMERSEEHTSELQSHSDLVCRLLLEKKKINRTPI